MSSEDKFKDRLKDLLSEQYYDYDASNWQKASDELDKQEKKKRRFFYLFFFGLGLGLLVAGYLFFKPDSASRAGVTALKTKAPAALVNSQTASQPLVRDVQDVQKPTAKKHEPVNPLTALNPNPALAKQAVKPIPTAPTAKPGESKTLKEKNQPLSNALPAMVQSKAKTREPLKESVTIANNPAKPILTSSMAAAVTASITKKEKEPVTVKTTASENIKTEGLAVADSVKNAPADSDTKPLSKSIDEPKETPVVIASPAKPESEAKISNRPDSLLGPVKDSLIAKTPAAPATDTSAKVPPQPTTSVLPRLNYYYADAGTCVNLGWSYQEVREGSGFNPCLGFNYVNIITRKINLSIGAYYTSVAYLKLANKQTESLSTTANLQSGQSSVNPAYPGEGLTLVYGAKKDVVKISPTLLNYLLVPAKFHYHLNTSNSITFGYSLAYLVGVRSQVETYTENFNLVSNKRTTKTWGYVEGYKTLVSQLNLGYRRKLYNNIWLYGELLYGLSDLRDNDFFGIKLTERATGVKMSLIYNFIKK